MLGESELDFQHVLMATGLTQTLVAVPWGQQMPFSGPGIQPSGPLRPEVFQALLWEMEIQQQAKQSPFKGLHSRWKRLPRHTFIQTDMK